MLSHFLRGSARFPAHRATRSSVACLSRRTIWEVSVLSQIAKEFGPNWPSVVDKAEVSKWLTKKGLAKIDEYFKEKPEEALRKAAYDAQLVRDDSYAELLPERFEERDEVVDRIIKTARLRQKFFMVSGPKAIGKSTLLRGVARELNTREGYRCIWLQCHESEEEFLNEWLIAMGVSYNKLSDVFSFEQAANILIDGRGDLSFEHVGGEDMDFHGSTGFTVDSPEKTIVFVDGLRERYSYIYRLTQMARLHSQKRHVVYVLIASDSADSFRSVKKYETRINHVRCHPFNDVTMKEFILFTLRETSVEMFGDRDRIVVDQVKDENGKTALDRLVDVVKMYTWQATNAADFVVAGVNPDGSFSEEQVAAAGQAFAEDYSEYVSAQLRGEAGWNMNDVRKLIEEFGDNNVMDVYKYWEVLGDPSELSERNFAYHDKLNVYLMPEAFQAMKYMIKRDAMVGK